MNRGEKGVAVGLTVAPFLFCLVYFNLFERVGKVTFAAVFNKRGDFELYWVF